MLLRSIRTKFLIYLLLFSLISLSFMAYFGYNSAKKFIYQIEKEKVNFFCENVEEKFTELFNNSNDTLFFLKYITEEILNKINSEHKIESHIRSVFFNFVKTNRQYEGIRLIDKYGNERISVNKSQIFDNNHFEKSNQYRKNEYYIKEGLKLKKEEVFISEIYLLYIKSENTFKPMIDLLTPVYKGKELEEFLILTVDIDYILEDIEKLKTKNKYQNIIIIDENGDYLLDFLNTKKEYVRKDLNKKKNFKEDYPQFYNKIVNSKSLNINLDKTNMIAWYPINIEKLNNKKLFLLIKVDIKQYLSSFIKFREVFIIQIVVIILILIVIGMMLTKHFTAPILKLSEAALSIGKGYFDIDLDIKTNDELEVLSNNIKNMSWELENMYKNMQEIVDEKTKKLKEAHEILEEMAIKDPLTGLYNRHYFNQYIQNFEFEEAKKHKKLMILIIDVDEFKYINDNYGHNIGDIVLMEVAKLLKNSSRESDIVVRYGGDEFLVILFDSDMKIVEKFINRFNDNLKHWNKTSNVLNHDLTVSIGYDEYNEGQNILEVINNADKMMYRNKMTKKRKIKKEVKDDKI
ncbi:diguanylate cyclase [Caminicella sporogenes]|uniref:diguanylate cyclase n=1 Tax=Caminicella sporogenes TaxID=166485 RepID=UPI00253F8B4A|nr:diguanylate cyclase [Caminicella sporogenes]WIF95359.1 diguanylate cyclase [Caminicella sporogenes]